MSRHSLRGNSPDTTLLTPIPDPNVTRPDGWNKRSLHNWKMYMEPVHSQLPEYSQQWYRRVYRPLHSTAGVRERKDISAWTEEDYVAEAVASKLFDDKEFRLPSRRQAARVRADVDLDDIASDIVHAASTLTQQRPSGQAPTIDVDANTDSDDLPFTPAIAVGRQRKP